MNNPILILGAEGQLGQELVLCARQLGSSVVGATRADIDIRNAKAVAAAVQSFRPHLIVNCAAYTDVNRAESEPDHAAAINAVGAGHVAAAANASGVPLIHISTDYVFDGAKPNAYTEDDPVAPLGVYGRTKADGEDAVRQATQHHIILRTSWLFGRFGSNFLKAILRLAAEQPVLHVIGDQRGCPTATADVARAILAIDTKLDAFASVAGTYHFAGAGVTTWHEFAETVVAAQSKITGKSPKVEAIRTADYPAAAARPANSTLDSTRFERTFAYRSVEWMQRVEETVTCLIG